VTPVRGASQYLRRMTAIEVASELAKLRELAAVFGASIVAASIERLATAALEVASDPRTQNLALEPGIADVA
jgi:hypothetical protein